MRATFECKLSIPHLALLAGLIPKNPTLHILSGIRLESDDGVIIATATDLDNTLAAIIPAVGKPDDDEPCVLPGHRVMAIFKSGAMLRLESNCKSASLSVDGRALTTMQFDIKQFPITPRFKDEPAPTRADVKAGDLLLSLERVKDAISTDESRYVLNGICFEHMKHFFQVVATDGRMLTQTSVHIQSPAPVTTPPSAILPHKGVLHLIRMLKLVPESEPVTILYSDNRMRVIAEDSGLLLVSKLIEGNYPNWRQVVPATMRCNVKIDPDEWIAALKVARGSTSEGNASVHLHFEKDNVRITAKDGQGNKAEVPIKHITWNDKPLTTAFDPHYLITALTPHKGAAYEVMLGVTDELSPARFMFNQYLHNGLSVVMPMRMS